MNYKIDLNFFNNQTFRFKVYFFSLIILSIILFFLDSLSIITILPVILNFNEIQLNNHEYFEYIPEIFIPIIESLDHKTIVIIFILVLFLRNILNILQSVILYFFDKHLEIETSKKIFDLHIRKDFLKFYEVQSNELLKDLRDSLIGYCLYVGSFIKVFSESILLFLLAIFLFYISFYETLVISIFFVCVIFIFRLLFFRYSEKLGKRYNQAASKINLIIIELNRNFIQIILRKLKKNYVNKYITTITESARSRLLAQFFKSNTKQFLEIILLIFVAIVFVTLTTADDFGKYFPLLLVYLISIYRILPLINNISANFLKIKNFNYSYNIIQTRLNEHNLKYKSLIKDNLLNEKINFKKSIKLNNLSFKYKKNYKYIFKNLNLEIKKKEMIGIIGESGSGKSTLLKIIMGIIKPNKGKIFLDKKKINNNDLFRLQNLIGFLPQENILINGSLKENIAFGEVKIDSKLVKKSVAKANCATFINKLKNKLDHNISEHGKNFSVGQLQRIGLARMIYFDNEIFFFDEPTSALDIKSQIKFVNLLKKFKNKKTIVIVSHQKNILNDCNKIYKVKNNKIIRIR